MSAADDLDGLVEILFGGRDIPAATIDIHVSARPIGVSGNGARVQPGGGDFVAHFVPEGGTNGINVAHVE